ncbi:MAG: PD40 domain-containing protein [Pirellulales bacterium]|nr:PD40 domain-containing protein [Pirellulales bacterium]
MLGPTGKEKRFFALATVLWFAVSCLLAIDNTVSAAHELRDLALAGPMSDCEEIIFVQRVSGSDHWYGNFGHYSDGHAGMYAPPSTPSSLDYFKYAFGDGGRLCRFNLRTRKLVVLLDDPDGGLRDPNVHYEGKKILFSYRRGGTTAYHLYEINVDGTNLKQLTEGHDNDIEPIYTPDGSIIFCSSRCLGQRRYVRKTDAEFRDRPAGRIDLLCRLSRAANPGSSSTKQ